MMWTFTATGHQNGTNEIAVPYLEDARADFAPYYRSGMTIAQAQTAVITEMAKLVLTSGGK